MNKQIMKQWLLDLGREIARIVLISDQLCWAGKNGEISSVLHKRAKEGLKFKDEFRAGFPQAFQAAYLDSVLALSDFQELSIGSFDSTMRTLFRTFSVPSGSVPPYLWIKVHGSGAVLMKKGYPFQWRILWANRGVEICFFRLTLPKDSEPEIDSCEIERGVWVNPQVNPGYECDEDEKLSAYFGIGTTPEIAFDRLLLLKNEVDNAFDFSELEAKYGSEQ